jgi:hypothetical protein
VAGSVYGWAGGVVSTWRLWIRADDAESAERQGRVWADQEPHLDFEGIVAVEPHPEFRGVWYVTVAAGERITEQPTLDLFA